MAQIHESVASFLSALTSGLEELLSEAGADQAAISWTPRAEESPRSDLVWWSCGLSVDPGCRLMAGAPVATWNEIGRAAGLGDATEDRFAVLRRVLQGAAQARFGSEVLCTDLGTSEEPPSGWTAVTVNAFLGTGSCPPLDLVLSPELEVALGGDPQPPSPGPTQEWDPQTKDLRSVDRLMHVEIPVSVLLGRTQMRMKDLLALSHGSIVELDQELSDEVEIRVSNCTIARGEVVAVDGNYGVRILKMISGRIAPSARGSLSDGDAGRTGDGRNG